VLSAMENVPRELFVPPELRRRAYADEALPIGSGQTISQPYMVARICEALAAGPGRRVLDVGAGSGYQAAVLAELGAEVHTIERLPARLLRELGKPFGRVHLGFELGEHGRLVTGACADVEHPPSGDRPELLADPRDHVRLRDRLPVTDR